MKNAIFAKSASEILFFARKWRIFIKMYRITKFLVRYFEKTRKSGPLGDNQTGPEVCL